jgi:hypothetical protein
MGSVIRYRHLTQGQQCEQSHNLDVILDYEENSTSSIEDRPTKKLKTVESVSVALPTANGGFDTYHSACFDAFMTGYIFAHQRLTHDLTGEKNRVYLIGKSMPLKIETSRYAKPSAQLRKTLGVIN